MEGDISKSGDSRGELQEEQRATPVVSRTRLCRINFDNVSLILKPHRCAAKALYLHGLQRAVSCIVLASGAYWVSANSY